MLQICKLKSANRHLFCNIKLTAVIPCESHGKSGTTIKFSYLSVITNLSTINMSTFRIARLLLDYLTSLRFTLPRIASV